MTVTDTYTDDDTSEDTAAMCDAVLDVTHVDARGPGRTRHVVCHTCGLDDDLPADPDSDVVTGLDYNTPHYPPGPLDDLMMPAASDGEVMPLASAVYEVAEIALELLLDNPDNPRDDIGDVTELAAAIRSVGLLEPLVVVPVSLYAAGSSTLVFDDDGLSYVLVAGHRRKAACALAGLETATCIIRRDLTGEQARIAMLVENLQRVDLAVFEEANAYGQLVDLGLTQRDIARRVGRHQSHISKRLGLLKLPTAVQDMVAGGQLPVTDALELIALADRPDDALAAARHVNDHGGVAAAVKTALAETRIKDEQAAAVARAKDAGLTVVKGPKYGNYWEHNDGKEWVDLLAARRCVADADEHIHHDCHAVAVIVEGWGTDRQVETRAVCTNPSSHQTAADAKRAAEDRKRKAAAELAEQQQRERTDRRLEIVRRTLTGRVGRGVEEYALDLALIFALRSSSTYQDSTWKLACHILELGDDGTGDEISARLIQFARTSISHRTRTVAAIAAAIADEEVEDRYQHNPQQVARYRDWLLEHGWEPTPEENPPPVCAGCEADPETDECGNEQHLEDGCPGWPKPTQCCGCAAEDEPDVETVAVASDVL